MTKWFFSGHDYVIIEEAYQVDTWRASANVIIIYVWESALIERSHTVWYPTGERFAIWLGVRDKRSFFSFDPFVGIETVDFTL